MIENADRRVLGLVVHKYGLEVCTIGEEMGDVIDRRIRRNWCLDWFAGRARLLVAIKMGLGALYWAHQLQAL